eukprot:scaffold127746_cov69-Phaeocystis_antarctica.AAC.2
MVCTKPKCVPLKCSAITKCEKKKPTPPKLIRQPATVYASTTESPALANAKSNVPPMKKARLDSRTAFAPHLSMAGPHAMKESAPHVAAAL